MSRATTAPKRRTRKPIRRQPTTTASSVYDDWTCPVNPEHGRMHDYYGGTHGYCPHAECNRAGRQNFWTTDEIRAMRTS